MTHSESPHDIPGSSIPPSTGGFIFTDGQYNLLNALHRLTHIIRQWGN